MFPNSGGTDIGVRSSGSRCISFMAYISSSFRPMEGWICGWASDSPGPSKSGSIMMCVVTGGLKLTANFAVSAGSKRCRFAGTYMWPARANGWGI